MKNPVCYQLCHYGVSIPSLLLQTLVRNLEDFLLLLLPLTCSMCLIHSILTATLTNAAPKDSTGQMLGMNMAVHSAIRSFAPSIGGTKGFWRVIFAPFSVSHL